MYPAICPGFHRPPSAGRVASRHPAAGRPWASGAHIRQTSVCGPAPGEGSAGSEGSAAAGTPSGRRTLSPVSGPTQQGHPFEQPARSEVSVRRLPGVRIFHGPSGAVDRPGRILPAQSQADHKTGKQQAARRHPSGYTVLSLSRRRSHSRIFFSYSQ